MQVEADRERRKMSEAPSAPPWPPQEAYPPPYYPESGDGGDAMGRMPSRYREENETLGARLVDMTAGFVKGLWRTSYTVLSVDLKRAAISYEGPPVLKRWQRQQRPRPRGALVSPYPQGHNGYVDEEEDESSSNTGWGARVQATQAQARLKVMQVWDLSSKGAEEEPRFPWRLNLGIGGIFEMDKGQLQPKLRLRAKHASLHLLPEPLLELRGKWPLGSTPMGVDVRYKIPLTALDKMWESPRLMVNLFKLGGPGVEFTPGGLLFDENVIELGKYTKMRIAAALEFPRELPLKEGERPFKLEVRRIGVKARTL